VQGKTQVQNHNEVPTASFVITKIVKLHPENVEKEEEEYRVATYSRAYTKKPRQSMLIGITRMIIFHISANFFCDFFVLTLAGRQSGQDLEE
jgi:hypothetical protein